MSTNTELDAKQLEEMQKFGESIENAVTSKLQKLGGVVGLVCRGVAQSVKKETFTSKKGITYNKVSCIISDGENSWSWMMMVDAATERQLPMLFNYAAVEVTVRKVEYEGGVRISGDLRMIG